MRKEIHRRIRKSGPGLNVVADIDAVVVVNDGTARTNRARDREARRADASHEAHRPEGGADNTSSGDDPERKHSTGGT